MIKEKKFEAQVIPVVAYQVPSQIDLFQMQGTIDVYKSRKFSASDCLYRLKLIGEQQQTQGSES